MNMIIPNDVLTILEKLEHNGYEAYVVGGCVRDTLLNKAIHDWDVTTSALPHEVQTVFKHDITIETGIQHGTVTVITEGHPVEITTFRIDGTYSDSRRPERVTFTSSLTQDLARRDFTINAMAYHPAKGLIDPFGGKHDLQQKTIRCVGNARSRFEEDALRILRALRFSSTLNFQVNPDTANALLEEKAKLCNISAERVREELIKLLCGKNCAQVLRIYGTVLAVWIPEILPMIGFQQHTPYHAYDVWEHTIRTVEAIQPIPVLRFTMLLHDIGKPNTFTQDEQGIGHFYGHGAVSTEMAKRILERLKFDRKTKESVIMLVKYHDIRCELSPIWIKKQLRKFGTDLFLQLLEVHKADITGQNPNLLHRLEDIMKCEAMAKEILSEPPCFSVKDLAVNGSDLIALGFSQGKIIGTILQFLLDAVIDETCKNEKKELLEYLNQNKFLFTKF